MRFPYCCLVVVLFLVIEQWSLKNCSNKSRKKSTQYVGLVALCSLLHHTALVLLNFFHCLFRRSCTETYICLIGFCSERKRYILERMNSRFSSIDFFHAWCSDNVWTLELFYIHRNVNRSVFSLHRLWADESFTQVAPFLGLLRTLALKSLPKFLCSKFYWPSVKRRAQTQKCAPMQSDSDFQWVKWDINHYLDL